VDVSRRFRWVAAIRRRDVLGLKANAFFGRRLKNVMRAGKTRPYPKKKRILCTINERFEEDFNAV
jgi:hypothetical protein